MKIVYENLAKFFPTIRFVEIYDALCELETDFSQDIGYLAAVDYLGYVGEKAFGIQIKPTTAKSNFGTYSVSEQMKASFQDFTDDFSGKVFIVFSLDGEIGNPEVIPEIEREIELLSA